MKKRCFPRYDTHIDARYRIYDAHPEWKSCRIIKISRKGIGVVFPAGVPPSPGSLLQFEFLPAGESGYITLQGVLKWIESVNNSSAGGIELHEIVDEALWLHMIYSICEPAPEKQIVDIKTIREEKIVVKTVHPPPAKVIVPSMMDHIKNILTYKIL